MNFGVITINRKKKGTVRCVEYSDSLSEKAGNLNPNLTE